ncbi:MAG: rhombosortase [Steroidobacteraceae bacterium]
MNRVRGLLGSLNCDAGFGLALLAACALLLSLTAAGHSGALLLRYDRAGLAEGQVWRLLTAHLVHLGVRHALLNCLGLVLLWALFARDYTPRQWLPIVLGAMAAIDAGLWWFDSTVLWYVGSSGVLHGVMAAGALAHLRRREPDGWLLGAFLLAKLTWEQWMGALPLSGSDPVVVQAHLYGVVGGLAMASIRRPAAKPL